MNLFITKSCVAKATVQEGEFHSLKDDVHIYAILSLSF